MERLTLEDLKELELNYYKPTIQLAVQHKKLNEALYFIDEYCQNVLLTRYYLK